MSAHTAGSGRNQVVGKNESRGTFAGPSPDLRLATGPPQVSAGFPSFFWDDWLAAAAGPLARWGGIAFKESTGINGAVSPRGMLMGQAPGGG